MVRPLSVSLLAALLLLGGAEAISLENVGYLATIHAQFQGGHFSFVPKELRFPEGAVVALVYNSTKGGGPHNIHITEGLPEGNLLVGGLDSSGNPTNKPQTRILQEDTGVSEPLVFVMPSSRIRFVCDVHPEMVATLVPTKSFDSFGAGAGEGPSKEIPKLGVHFLAYWVGVIAFIALFLIYGATYFLFKYNESSFTTDHRDRASSSAESDLDPVRREGRSLRNELAALGTLLVFGAVTFWILWSQGILQALLGGG